MRIPFIKLKFLLVPLLIWTIIGIGALLRVYNGDAFPIDNNDDGLFYVWTGTSLFENPLQLRSHTIFDSYNQTLLWRSQYRDYIPHERFGMKIAEPWFDHPPLGSVFISLPAYLLGYTQVEQLPHMIVRYPALLASILTMLLTFFIARKLFGQRVGFWSLLFIATTPYFVFAHRQSYLENFLTPLFLGSLMSFLQYQDSKKTWQLVLAALLAFFCGWVKIPAFAVPAMLAGWACLQKDWRAVKILVITAFLSIASYLLYGFLSAPDFFAQTVTNQGVRGMYLSSFVYSFVKPVFYGDFMDGLYILGMLSGFMILFKKDKSTQEQYYAWFYMAWLLVLFLVSGKYNNSPWYRYPLIPFMSIGLGVFFEQLWQKKSLFLAALFLLFGFSGFDLAGIEFSSSLLRPVTVLLFLPFVALFFYPKISLLKTITSITTIILVALMIVGNVLAINQYPFEHCAQEACLLPVKIILEQK